MRFKGIPLKEMPRISGIQYSRLNRLDVAGFKAFGDKQSLPIAPITLVFGANSSGKSSLIQALALMRELVLTDEADVRFPKLGERRIDLGGFENYRSRFSNLKDVGLTLSFRDIDHADIQYDYGISVGPSRITDNEFFRNDLHGKDLDYAVNSISVAGSGIRYSVQLTLFFVGIEDQQNPLSYNFRWNEFEVAEEGLQFLLLPAFASEENRFNERLRSLGILTDQDELGREKYILAVKWLLNQEHLVTYICRGKLAGLNSFNTGGYFKDEESDEGEEVFLPSSVFSTETAARDHLRNFLEIECLGVDDNLLPITDELFNDIWDIAVDRIPKSLSKLSSKAYTRYHSLLTCMRYLGPIREMPGRYIADKYGHLDRESQSSGIGAYSEIMNNSSLLGKVNHWLSGRILNKEYLFKSMECVPIGTDVTDRSRELRFYERVDGKNIELSLQDVGSGVSQIVPVVTFCLGNTRKTLLMEQPELHLHPSGAAEMGDLLIESALSNRNTIIAETHSEHLILRILKRIRQTYDGSLPGHLPPIKAEDVSVVFVKPKEKCKGSEIVPIPITEDGDILFGWPDGFLPDRLGEFF